MGSGKKTSVAGPRPEWVPGGPGRDATDLVDPRATGQLAPEGQVNWLGRGQLVEIGRRVGQLVEDLVVSQVRRGSTGSEVHWTEVNWSTTKFLRGSWVNGLVNWPTSTGRRPGSTG
jgi:hypothetical protein